MVNVYVALYTSHNYASNNYEKCIRQFSSFLLFQILKGLSLTVKYGETVALVGHSGCGKSTIIQLISRFYDVVDGSVCLDGNDVRMLSVNWLRSQIGLVGQQPVLFNASIRDNILYGREDATNDDVKTAAEQAYAHRFITKLPKGYDTIVGEGGAALSGGQKQRIAIARALIRNPKILLLDEATSALDLTSEAKVQKALDKAAKGRTTIIVAHRQSTIRNANKIYVMKDGIVVEEGNHEELMALKGYYWDMVVLQERHEPMNTEIDADLAREESKTSERSVSGTGVIDPLDEEKRHTPKLSFWRVIRLNAPEWKSITVGCICSIIIGFSMPLFIVVFGDLFGATGQRIGVVLQGIGSIGLAVVLAMLFEWRVGLIVLSFFPVVAVVIYYQGKAIGQESRDNAKTLEDSTMIAIEAVSNVRTVASLGRERRVLAEYSARLWPAMAPARRAAHCRGIVAGLSRSMFYFINATALTTTQSLQMASGQAQNAFTFAPDFQKGIKAGSRIVEFLKIKPQIIDPENPIPDFNATGEANFKGIEFKYPNRPTVKVLKGLDLHLERGHTIALVGQSGCGKSTVIQILERFYDPDVGTVSLDDVPLPLLRIREVRASLGLVSQEPVLFDRTIAENIAYGDNSRTLPHDDIVEAAKQANIHNFIVSLPQLSGGQKQRVAIARALVRNPRILLLDEATSALDSESEKLVHHRLLKLRCSGHASGSRQDNHARDTRRRPTRAPHLQRLDARASAACVFGGVALKDRRYIGKECRDTDLGVVNPFSPPVFKGAAPINVTAHERFFYMHNRLCEERYIADTNFPSNELYLQQSLRDNGFWKIYDNNKQRSSLKF
ncbi:unnamed protein product [Diatraea saccharalis]|uniref:Uncharacterized protein n=1 Tax=Diatraea saccharalis TaxID=40085 RepID=A0A9N9R021_9NEOP|nr:unnamed protein product [Diatraea saccharalis]